MIVVDSSIWIDFLRRPHDRIFRLIEQDALLQHPFVTGEVGMGSFASAAVRFETIKVLFDLAPLAVVPDAEFHTFVGDNMLYGTGAGFVDCHLLASLSRVSDARLWTSDGRLAALANRLELPLYD